MQRGKGTVGGAEVIVEDQEAGHGLTITLAAQQKQLFGQQRGLLFDEAALEGAAEMMQQAFGALPAHFVKVASADGARFDLTVQLEQAEIIQRAQFGRLLFLWADRGP